MVKQLVSTSSEKSSTVQIQDSNHPQGCMWGLLYILDYHHWHVKRVFAHKRRRHARYKSKTILHNQGEEEDQQYGVAEAEHLLAMQHSRNLSATGKCSPKNSKKGLVTENRLKEENSKGRILSLPGESQARNKVSSEVALHLEKDGNTTEAVVNQKRTDTRTNKFGKDISSKFKKHNDVFRVEKDILLKFLREFDVGGKNLHQASNSKARLTKSGSFPLASSSNTRSITPSTLKHKQNEVWAFPKGEKLLDGTKATKMSASSLVKDISYEKPMPLASDHSVDSSMKQKTGISSRSSHGLNHKGWNQLVLHRFKVIKQKIKHALVEFRRSGYQTSLEANQRSASLEYSITNNEKEVSQSLEDGVDQEYLKNKSSNEAKSSVSFSNRHEVRLVRRTSSLNESLDKYTQLFEKSFSADIKWHSSKSKSLRLITEDKMNKSGRLPTFSRSNFSLPNIESLGFILHEALLDMNESTDIEETNNHVQGEPVSLPLKKDKSFGQVEETEITQTVEGSGRDVNQSPLSGKVVEKIDEVVTSEQREDIHDEAVVGDESFPQEKEELSMTIYPSNTTSNAEGRGLNNQGSSMDESKTESPNAVVAAEDTTNKNLENHSLLLKSETDNDSNFKFVKAILEISGFMGNDQIQMQHRTDQPLKKPSLLKVVDESLRHETESSAEESIKTNDHDHHQLLFNLVSEVLLELQEKSPSYFPRPFSFNYRLHPMPKGNHLLNQVWHSANSYLSLRPELDQTLDVVVGRDLAKRSGWMNLQQEEEYVALELEEMIMEDLIDEITFS